MRIDLLGPLQVDGADGRLSPRDRVVLAALAMRPGEVLSADRLADALWPDGPPASWPKVVQGCVMRLRRTLDGPAIETAGGGYRLTATGDELDTQRFGSLVAQAQEHSATGSHERAASTLARALALWRGAPLGDLDGWPPGQTEAARLEELRRTAEEDLLDARLAAGEHRDVAADAAARAAEEPLRERRWAILALAQYRCGRQADALRSLHQARYTLADQLGIDPGPELVALEAAILRQDPALATERQPPPPVGEQCPYKGLAPYDAADSDRFFGRDADVTACLDRLAVSPLLVVAGPSGCGKSSLLRAGVVPALQRRGQTVVMLVPGRDAGGALANALASAADDAVLVVDQLEELFALDGPSDAAAFCRELAAYASERAPVVAAVRADHLAGLAVDPAFARLAEQGLHLVSPLAGEALREAIEAPAAQAGLHLEEGLVDLLVRDTEGEPGALPLLSHALAQTWQHRDGRVLTVAGYRATGGIRGAVARSADRLYESLPPKERTLLRSVMLRLVAPSPDGEPVRSRVPSRSLGGDEARERVVRLLVQARLVTTEEDAVELAHEALARAWPRLRSWLDEDATGQRILRHLSAAADGWESLGRPDSELYRGARLEAALEWRESANPDLTALEVAFLDAAVARATSEREAMAARARQQARQNRRLRGLLAVAAVLVVVSILAGLLALDSGRDARRQRDTARAAQDDAALEALVNRSLALRSTDRAAAALLAVEAHRRAPGDAGAHSALLGTFTAAPSFVGYQHLPADQFLTGALVPGTSTAVVALDGGDLKLLDLDTGELTDHFTPADEDAIAGRRPGTALLRVSDDARYAAHLGLESPQSCSGDPEVVRATDNAGCTAFSVYDVTSGRRVLGPVTPPFAPGDVAINADGSLVAVAGGFDGKVAVYRTSDGEQLGALPGLPRPADSGPLRDTATVTFGPDGRLYAGSLGGPIRAVEPDTLEVVEEYNAPPLAAHSNLVATPDGLVVGSGDDNIVAIDTSTGTRRWTVEIDKDNTVSPCQFLGVAASTERLYCGDPLGILEERELATGQRTGQRLDPQLGAVGDLAVDAETGDMLAFGQDVPVVSRWRLDGGGAVVDHIAEDRFVISGYDPTGEMLLVTERSITGPPGADPDLEKAVWDPVSDEPIERLDDFIGALWVGRDMLGGAFKGGTMGAYDLRTHARVPDDENPDPDMTVGDWVWMSPDGSRAFTGRGPTVFAGTLDGHCVIRTIDSDRGERVQPTIEIDDCGRVQSVSAPRDGSRVVVTAVSADFFTWRTTVHDGRTGEQIRGPLEGIVASSVSSDGVLVGGDNSGAVSEYDLDTLEPIGTFPGTRGIVDELRFSADGKTLVAISANETLSIYDVDTRTQLGDPIINDFPFFSGSIRPDGKAVATNDETGVAVWDIDPDNLAEAACRLAGRNLTRTEWDTYLSNVGDYRPTCSDNG